MSLEDISALQLLDSDPEPCLIVDLERDDAFVIAYSNPALKSDHALQDAILSTDQNAARFWQWLKGRVDAQLFEFSTKAWMVFVHQERWAVVRGQPPSPEIAQRYADAKPKRRADLPVVKSVSGAMISPTRPGLSSADSDHAETSDQGTYSHERLKVFHQMMQMSETGMFEYHPNGTLMHANESWYRLSGHPRELEKHTDFSFMDLVFPEDAALVMAQWGQLAQGIPVSFEMRWKKSRDSQEPDGPDADVQWVLSACVPILSPTGELVSIAGNTVDISAQKRSIFEANQRTVALERARASESRFSRFAARSPIAIFFYSPDKVCRYCNDQFFDLTGHPKVPFEEVSWPSIVMEEDASDVAETMETLFVEKQPVTMQIRLKRKWRGPDGVDRICWAQGSSYPELDDDGSLRSIMGTLIDISQLKFAESLQKLRVDEALEAKRQQENFIDMTSHEMRNPLSAVVQCADSTVSSLLEILNAVSTIYTEAQLEQPQMAELDQILQEAQNSLDAVQTIISCSTHQKRIIDDVLTLSKLDSDLLLITPVRIDPVATITDAIKMFELECSKLNIDLHFKKSESLQSLGVDWVRLDPSRLVQILINLLTNAIKFTQTQPIRTITVTLGACEERPHHTWPNIAFTGPPVSHQESLDAPEWGDGNKLYLWVTVQDTGCGLTPPQQQLLFSRFSQASPRTHVRYGGSGLGLFISKSLAEKQGGGIGVRSQEGVGSTFAFFVSTRLAPPPSPTLARDETRPSGSRGPSMEDKIKAAHYSVLVVEDNLVNQKVLAKQLVKMGCQVHIADHGRAALEFLEKTSFWKGSEHIGEEVSIILMDIEMPVLNGIDCAKEIRKLEESGQITVHIPILAVSANARSEQVTQALQAGMDDAIAKPFRIVDLLPKLERLARKRTRSEAN